MKENASVDVLSSSTRSLLAALLPLIVAFGCASKTPEGSINDPERYDRELVSCIENMKREVRPRLANSPDFLTLHELTMWVGGHFPDEIRSRLVDAGRSIAETQNDVTSIGVQKNYFSNIPALDALVFGKSSEHLDGLKLCHMSVGVDAVARDVLLDQINVGLTIRNNKIFERFKQLGVDDSHFAGQLILYGVIFDLGGVKWTDEQISDLVKYTPPHK